MFLQPTSVALKHRVYKNMGGFENRVTTFVDTPWKINGWNLQIITHEKKGTWPEASLHEDMEPSR